MSKSLIRIAVFLLVLCTVFPFAAGCGAGGEGDDTAAEPATSAPDVVIDPATAAAFKSDSFEVTGDMFAYYFYKDYYDAVEYFYSSYYQYLGLDCTKDLKEQNNSQSGESWFTEFRNITAQNVMKYLIFAEAAHAEGTDKGEDIDAAVEREISDLTSAAEEAGEDIDEFIAYRFGEGVTLDVIRRAVELYCIGNSKYEADLASFDYSDGECEEYYEGHKEDFLYVDYRRVEIRADQTEYATDAERDAAYAAAEKAARTIAASKNLNEYTERGIAYLKSVNGQNGDELTEEEIINKMTTVSAEYSYNVQSDFGKWAFSGERKDGDIVMLDNGAGIYSVFYLDRAPYRKENMTKNIRRISFAAQSEDAEDVADAEERANAALEAWNASDKTAEDFIAIGRKYGGSGGSLEENVDYGETSPYVQLWMYDSARKPGDCDLIQDSGVYYLVLFESDGDLSWRVKARDALLTADIDALFKSYQDKYGVEYDVDVMNATSGVNAYVRAAEKSADTAQ